MDAKEVVHCALQIEKFTADRSYGNIMTLLGDLETSHVTAEQLETTDIVTVLYRLLKTCTDNHLRKMAKNMLSKWKKQYSKDRRGSKCSEISESPSGSAQACNTQEERENPDLQDHKSSPERLSTSSDSVRSKCVQLLLDALCPNASDQDGTTELAANIEHHIHKHHGTNQMKYKACIRSKVANLRNPKNGHLREGLLSGSLLPEAFARMSAEEMASAELRQLREEYASQGVSERQLPQGVEGTQTQKIRCKRCAGSDCRVKQMSRGALFLPAWVRRGGPDEDAMTFVTCNGCGQQWYHSGWICL